MDIQKMEKERDQLTADGRALLEVVASERRAMTDTERQLDDLRADKIFELESAIAQKTSNDSWQPMGGGQENGVRELKRDERAYKPG
ncbi:unnamed protein product, partial [marine sediment metagenome]